MSNQYLSIGSVARTNPPAKLNLFLELVSKRDDGFHEIDTVMVPIDLCDQLSVELIADPTIRLDVDWLPSRQIIANRLGVAAESSLLDIPSDESNLVFQALESFRQEFEIQFGFHSKLLKRIPAGAGMGGASSDAASALLCAARLCGVKPSDSRIQNIAEKLGSDVPFFLGCPHEGEGRVYAARATGRGEKLGSFAIQPLHFVVLYPNESLSTARVYACSTIPQDPKDVTSLIAALKAGSLAEISGQIFNRLSEPAEKILPRVGEITKSMWRSGLQACQLTGSGSACFAILDSSDGASHAAKKLISRFEPGGLVANVRSTSVPSQVVIQ